MRKKTRREELEIKKEWNKGDKERKRTRYEMEKRTEK